MQSNSLKSPYFGHLRDVGTVNRGRTEVFEYLGSTPINGIELFENLGSTPKFSAACQSETPIGTNGAAGDKPKVADSVAINRSPVPGAGNATDVYLGDEHVHTSWSADAGMAGTTVGPENALRFARGENVTSSTGQQAQLHRALDGIAVTDHSDGMGTISGMQDGNPEMMRDATVMRWHDMM